MGFAMAATYGTLNPAKVFKKIFQTFPAYLLVLLLMSVYGAATFAASMAIQIGLLMVLPGMIGALISGVLGGTIYQYGVVAGLAMMGRLLRKYRTAEDMPPPPPRKVLGYASQ